MIKTNRQLPIFVFVGLAFTLANAAAATRYVNLANPNPATPFTNWATAATNIQQAVDVAVNGDLVLVTNGIFQAGGRLADAAFGDTTTNRLVVTKQITVQSVNGPAVTIIKGYQLSGSRNGAGAVRCVFLADASLIGFTLSGGATETNSTSNQGGGLKCRNICVVSNCVFGGNTAILGGGIYSGISHSVFAATTSDCVLSNNVAEERGGGGYTGTFNSCLFVGNSAKHGGGASTDFSGTIALNNCTIYGNAAALYGGGVAKLDTVGGGYLDARNCIIISNTATLGSNYYYQSSYFWFTNCCSEPVPSYGAGNFAANPLFKAPGASDFRLQSSSPCINAGSPTASGNLDLDGNPRIVGGTVDIGAYEFQAPSSVLSYAWARQYGLPTDGSVDFSDTDGDGMNNYGEWRSDTIPTNALSVLRMVGATNTTTGANVTWRSVATRSYWLERATNLGVATPFQTVATNIAGVVGTKTFTDTSATNGGPYFYRVGVQ